MSLKFIITFHAKESTADAFLEIMRQVKTDLPGVDGCEGVQVLRSVGSLSKFTLVETWENREKHKANSQQLADSGSWERLVNLLSRKPDGSYYEEI